MEENQTFGELKNPTTNNDEPNKIDNSTNEEFKTTELEKIKEQKEEEGESSKSKDPSNELILGKFKSVEDLTKAYEELQKHQGHSSEELGSLRKEISSLNDIKDQFDLYNTIHNEYLEIIQKDKEKYSSEEYFQDPTFREIYKEALYSFGSNLDTEKLVNLLESYVSSRIQANEKKKLAEKETQSIIDSMNYEKNPKNTFTPPKKSFDEMTDKEIDEMLERLI